MRRSSLRRLKLSAASPGEQRHLIGLHALPGPAFGAERATRAGVAAALAGGSQGDAGTTRAARIRAAANQPGLPVAFSPLQAVTQNTPRPSKPTCTDRCDVANGDTSVLVDGAKLAALMIEHAVGVSHRTAKVPKVDSDYFEE